MHNPLWYRFLVHRRSLVFATERTLAIVAPKPLRNSKYIAWSELLRRTFGIDVACSRCHGKLRLMALVKQQATIAKILGAIGHPTGPPPLAPARAPPRQEQLDWCN